MEKNAKWLWKGKMIDCNGRVSRFNLSEANANGSSAFLLELLERDGHASEFKGEAKVGTNEKEMSIQFQTRGEKQDQQAVSWSATLKSGSAGRYAKSSAFGTYESSGNETFLSRGVIVIWQFS